ncbi:T-cell surface antigen CD2-like [Pimephales promelas]|uniref:T-cell surface antigen CD2-like n=1 Tax=Pimephales promelas TaxID=90988 RepID=UPI001955823C|nr:T-cell surface antigen CD2-like [Pimephales promelas]
MFIFIFLCWSLSGVFGVDAVKSVSVTEGESVTLNTDTEIQTGELIMWRTGHNSLIAKIKGNIFERFRDRLTLNEKTGSLTITNTRTTDSGLYRVISTRSKMPLNTFNLTVYARLPVPVISHSSKQSSSSSSSNCSLLCSVLNESDATLSWYAGMSVLSSISLSDLRVNLSLPLEIECLDDAYSCVLNNTISNQTTHLNTELCRSCSGPVSESLIVLISSSSVAGSLMIVAAAVGIFCICKKHRKTDREVQTRDREITYADPTFYKRHKTRQSAVESDAVVYGGVMRR